MRPPSHGLWWNTLWKCVFVCVCVGGLFTFHRFLTGIPFSILYFPGKVHLFVCVSVSLCVSVCVWYIFRLLTGIQLATVLAHKLTPGRTPPSPSPTNKHILMDSLTLSGVLLELKGGNAILMCTACTWMHHPVQLSALSWVPELFVYIKVSTVYFPNSALSWRFLGNCTRHMCRRTLRDCRCHFYVQAASWQNLQSPLWRSAPCMVSWQ